MTINGAQDKVDYRQDIDGIRAIAVLAVVLFHAFPALLPGGFVGVDVFFVISGYLISSHIFQSLRSGSFSLLDFYVRRIRRIFPALIVVLAGCLVFGWFCLFSQEYAELGRLTAAGAAFSSNIVLWKTTGYFMPAANYTVLLHLWSLGVEEQYYIVWPLFLLLFRRRLNSILGLILLLTVLSFALNVIMVHLRAAAAFYLPMTRFWELLVGVILAYLELFRKGKLDAGLRGFTPAAWLQHTKSLIGACCILLAILCLDTNSTFPGWWALLPTVGTFLLISSGPGAWVNRCLLSHPLPVFFGMISYPLYLWHWPMFVFARILSDGTPGVLARLVVVSLAILLAWLVFRFVEVPVRFRPAILKPSRLATALTLLALMACVGTAGLAISRYDRRLSFRFAGAGYNPGPSGPKDMSPDCKARLPFATEFCQMSDGGATPTVVLLGDSHALHFYNAMKSHFDKRQENLVAVGEGDCPPFYDVDVTVSRQSKGCSTVNNPALDFAIQSPSVHTIILSAYSVADTTGFNFADPSGDGKLLRDLRNPQSSNNRTNYLAGLKRTVANAFAARKQVVFILDTPELDFSPSSCIVHRPLSLGETGIRKPCGIPLRTVNERQGDTRTSIRNTLSAFPGVKILDPLAALCDQTLCSAGTPAESFYVDRNHMSEKGANYLVSRFDW